MNIIVEKIEDKYFAIVRNFNKHIHKYKVKKSWEPHSACVTEIISHNLIKNPINLINHNLNLLDFSIELDPILNSEDYYTIKLITDDDLEYPFYIDINKFYNIEKNEKVYFYNFKPNEITLDPSYDKKYDFYFIGNFGDKHKLNLIQIVNDKKILFKPNDYNKYISEVYSLAVELNNKQIFKTIYPFYNSETEFVYTIDDYDTYYKYTFFPKYNYTYLKEFSIYFKEKMIDKLNLNSDKRNISIFLPKPKIGTSNDILIKYKIKENYIGSKEQTLSALFKTSLISKNKITINDFNYFYNFEKDTYTFFWNNSFLEPLKYKIVFDDVYEFLIKNNFFELKNIKEFHNGKEFFNFKILCDINNSYYELLDVNINNFYFIDSPYNFTPVIDYSDALLPESKTGLINWTHPNYKHTCKAKIKVQFIKQFLDEYLKPWQEQYVLEKESIEFDQIYNDYSEELPYDFDENGEYKYKSVNDSPISFEAFDNFIDIGEKDQLEIPIWYCDNDYKYEIAIQIYDRWGEFRGENKCEFIINSNTEEMKDEHIILDRNQEIQFGETGTIGTFYKIEKPTPIDVKYHYAPKYKKYLGQPLYDLSNVDDKKNSLYYYLNSNEIDKDFIIKYKRHYNFYKLTYEVLYNNEIVVPVTENIPKGNTFETNNFKISKSLLTREGEYLMNIKTFSSTNQESSVKEIKFYVYNDIPEVPVIEINPADYAMKKDKIVINKKYFSMNITNNKLNEKYAGWNYKEAHFYFKTKISGYNNYPDYVIQASKENGLISFKNTLSIENNSYECKVIAYDYAGNASIPYIFEFDLLSEMSIVPEVLFTNELEKPIKWLITKSQDSEGYFRQFKYSSDGINFIYTDPVKVDSPYNLSDPNSSQLDTIKLNWIYDEEKHEYKQGKYQLVVYEWNLRHPNGLSDNKFESPIVEVNKTSNPSNPINAKPIDKKVAVFNERKFNEYSYVKDLNDITFETIHNESVIDKNETELIEGQYYKIKLIDPSKNEYETILPPPKKIGMYSFDKIAEKCNIENQIEGVWELQFITIDKFGNSNEYKGYYTYYINVVKRNPEITNVVLNNLNGSEYFGLSSEHIGAFVETECYNNISNFKKHIEKFSINKFKIVFLSTPNNAQYSIISTKNKNNLVEFMNKLTEQEKINHIKDGKYLITIQAIDPLDRKSVLIEKKFYIDTKNNSQLFFITPNIFYNKNVTLIASTNDDAYKVYYKIIDKEIDPSDNYKNWNYQTISTIEYNHNTFNGCKIDNLIFDTDGRKTIAYVIEELSGNTTELFYYNFIVDSSVKIAPIFDYSNKVFYTLNNDLINITWNLSSEHITNYKIKLDKIELKSNGDITVVQSYNLSVLKDGLLVPVGPNENHWIDWGTDKSCSFKLSNNTFLVNGLYMLSVKSTSKYGDLEVNDFKFQIDTNNMIDISEMITKNVITIDSNKLTWSHIATALYYEISYDNRNFYRTFNNYFIVDTEKLMTDKNGISCVYLRYTNKNGRISESSKISLNIIAHNLKKPIVSTANNSSVIDDNRVIEWKIIVEDPDVAKYIYYSFDNINWKVAKVKGRTNIIIDDIHNFPIPDGEYSIFACTTDENPINNDYYSKSSIAYSFVNIFAKSIPTPEFLNLKSGEQIEIPKQLFISNKIDGVDYFIYVNDRLVNEGHEISSSTLKKFNIRVDAIKRGIENKIFHLIDKKQDFHIWSLTTSEYILNIKNEKIKCVITNDNCIEIQSMPNLSNKQIILYRDKNTIDKNFNILRLGDRLSLLNEWEFRITTFEID